MNLSALTRENPVAEQHLDNRLCFWTIHQIFPTKYFCFLDFYYSHFLHLFFQTVTAIFEPFKEVYNSPPVLRRLFMADLVTRWVSTFSNLKTGFKWMSGPICTSNFYKFIFKITRIAWHCTLKVGEVIHVILIELYIIFGLGPSAVSRKTKMCFTIAPNEIW